MVALVTERSLVGFIDNFINPQPRTYLGQVPWGLGANEVYAGNVEYAKKSDTNVLVVNWQKFSL